MDILQYNILDGCQDEHRLQKLTKWIKNRNDDVIGFNELNGWTAEQFNAQGKEWGFSYSYVFEMKESPYFIGIISKSPIKLMQKTEDSFHHGLLHVLIQGVHFFVTHLSPNDSIYREVEARKIVQHVDPYKDVPVVLMGDFNTLSPKDVDYDQGFIPKEYTKNGNINYEPMQILMNAPLYDTFTLESLQYSIPTRIIEDIGHVKVRIDYILVNDVLLKCHPTSEVIQDEEVEWLSDHYPIACQWHHGAY